jgi:hypothetical protein
MYFVKKPSPLIVGLMDASRSGCVISAQLEIVPITIFSGYTYIGNAIIQLDGTKSQVGPQIGQLNSWVVTLTSNNGILPMPSTTGQTNFCYVTFTPI